MKLRSDFVTNSSSSSYIVVLPKWPNSPEELGPMLFEDKDIKYYRHELRTAYHKMRSLPDWALKRPGDEGYESWNENQELWDFIDTYKDTHALVYFTFARDGDAPDDQVEQEMCYGFQHMLKKDVPKWVELG